MKITPISSELSEPIQRFIDHQSAMIKAMYGCMGISENPKEMNTIPLYPPTLTRMQRVKKIFKAIGAFLSGKQFVSGYRVINGSVWWHDQSKLQVRCFEELSLTTAIALIHEHSVNIYFPEQLTVHGEPPIYTATLRLRLVMLRTELIPWVTKIAEHPFI